MEPCPSPYLDDISYSNTQLFKSWIDRDEIFFVGKKFFPHEISGPWKGADYSRAVNMKSLQHINIIMMRR